MKVQAIFEGRNASIELTPETDQERKLLASVAGNDELIGLVSYSDKSPYTTPYRQEETLLRISLVPARQVRAVPEVRTAEEAGAA